MSLLSLYIMLTALVTAYACVLPGVFMVLRGVALMSDAISHAILLGIVLMFFCIHNLNSPWLIIGAACSGLITVLATEALIQTACLKKDAAIGLIFPLFFSIAVILISVYTRDIHLDMDMVLLGELAFVPFNRLVIYGVDMGPVALWVMSIIGLCNTLLVYFFYKELQLSIFDPEQAYLAQRSPQGLYYGLMAMASITAVGAFDVVGSIVVVALMITPAATAFMMTYTLHGMLIGSVCIGTASALGGYAMAWILDVSIAGSIAAVSGFICALVFLCAPRTGLCVQWWREFSLKNQLFLDIICVYLSKKEQLPGLAIEHIAAGLNWNVRYTHWVLAQGVRRGMLIYTDSYVELTDYGRERAGTLHQRDAV